MGWIKSDFHIQSKFTFHIEHSMTFWVDAQSGSSYASWALVTSGIQICSSIHPVFLHTCIPQQAIHCSCASVLAIYDISWSARPPFCSYCPIPSPIEFVGFQISVLGMSNNAALEELCGPEVEEFLDSQFSRVGDAHRQARRKSRQNRRKRFNNGSNISFFEEISTSSTS